MGLEFLPICDVLFNVVSLASYFCDIVFDVIATYSFYSAGHTVWLWISLVSILTSLITCQVLSGKWLLSEETTSQFSKRKLSLISALHVTGCGMIWRYSQLFAPIHLDHVKREMRNLCVLRMIHGFVESMPLLLMQTYIAFQEPGKMLEVNVISMALSLFNVCWALASFTKNIRSHNVHRLVLTWIGVIFQFMWRLGTVTSRVLVLVLYSMAFNYWVFLVVILHWITMFLWVLSRYTTIQNERLTTKNKLMLSVFVSFVHVFCYLNLEEQNTRIKIVTYYTIMLVENVLLITLWTLGTSASLAATTPISDNLDEHVQWFAHDRTRIYVAVFTSFFVGIFFMVIYYRFFHVRKLSATLSYSPTDHTETKTKQVGGVGGRDAVRAINGSRSVGSGLQDPAVTVFNCALNPALRKKKKMPSRTVPPPGSTASDSANNLAGGGNAAGVPFWKEPLPGEVRTEGDGLSYSRTTSVDDIRQKLQEKKDKQLEELRRIELDIAEGRRERPSIPVPANRPVPVKKYPPIMNLTQAGSDNLQNFPPGHHHLPPHSSSSWIGGGGGGEYLGGGGGGDYLGGGGGSLAGDQDWRPNAGGSYIGVSQPDPPTPVPAPLPPTTLPDSSFNSGEGPGSLYNPSLSSSTPLHSSSNNVDTSHEMAAIASPIRPVGHFQFDERPPEYPGPGLDQNPATSSYGYHPPGYHPNHPSRQHMDPHHHGLQQHQLQHQVGYHHPFQQHHPHHPGGMQGPPYRGGGPQQHLQGPQQPLQGPPVRRSGPGRYADSSGEHADIDSGDDRHMAGGGMTQPAFRSPRLPLPLPRNRVVIGGHDHETPL